MILTMFSAALADPGDGSAREVLRPWMADAADVVHVEVREVEVLDRTKGDLPLSRVVFRVGRVIAGDALAAGEELELVLEGASFGDHGVLTSYAPVFATGDRGLLKLDETEGGALVVASGNRSFLPIPGDVIELCVNPDPEALAECARLQMPTFRAPGPLRGPQDAFVRTSLDELVR